MDEPVRSVFEALGLSGRELVALVGGGGKTRLMRSLFLEARKAGLRGAATTTTRVAEREAAEIGKIHLWAHRQTGVGKPGPMNIDGLFIAGAETGYGKIEGISPETADLLFSDFPVDCLIVEADGAAGRPLKAPADHEPVIPSSATVVVAVMGLEAVGRPLTGGSAFRMDRIRSVTGLEPGDTITPEAIVPLFLSGSGLFRGCPDGARRVVLLNKADISDDPAGAVRLADGILSGAGSRVERVVVGSVARGDFFVFGVDCSIKAPP